MGCLSAHGVEAVHIGVSHDGGDTTAGQDMWCPTWMVTKRPCYLHSWSPSRQTGAYETDTEGLMGKSLQETMAQRLPLRNCDMQVVLAYKLSSLV